MNWYYLILRMFANAWECCDESFQNKSAIQYYKLKLSIRLILVFESRKHSWCSQGGLLSKIHTRVKINHTIAPSFDNTPIVSINSFLWMLRFSIWGQNTKLSAAFLIFYLFLMHTFSVFCEWISSMQEKTFIRKYPTVYICRLKIG